MKVRIREISTGNEKTKEFEDYNEMLEWMKDEYGFWTVNFSWINSDDDCELKLEKYDDYRE